MTTQPELCAPFVLNSFGTPPPHPSCFFFIENKLIKFSPSQLSFIIPTHIILPAPVLEAFSTQNALQDAHECPWIQQNWNNPLPYVMVPFYFKCRMYIWVEGESVGTEIVWNVELYFQRCQYQYSQSVSFHIFKLTNTSAVLWSNTGFAAG